MKAHYIVYNVCFTLYTEIIFNKQYYIIDSKYFFRVIPNKLIDKKGERLLKKYVMYMKTKK